MVERLGRLATHHESFLIVIAALAILGYET
jgi:hypothetical protein